MTGGMIEPHMERWGVSTRARRVNIGENAQAYAEFNFEQSSSAYIGYGLPAGHPQRISIRADGPERIRIGFNTAALPAARMRRASAPLALPVFICPRTTVAAVAPRPTARSTRNNPFAAAGNRTPACWARCPTLPAITSQRSRVYRLRGGHQRHVRRNWDYSVNALGMVNDLRRDVRRLYLHPAPAGCDQGRQLQFRQSDVEQPGDARLSGAAPRPSRQFGDVRAQCEHDA